MAEDLTDAEVAHFTQTQNPIYRSGSGNLTRTRTTLDFVNLTYLVPSPTHSSSSSSSSSTATSVFSDVSPIPGSYAGPKRSTSSPVFGESRHDAMTMVQIPNPLSTTLSMTYACWRPPKVTSGKKMCYGHMPADKTVFCHLCNAPACPLCRTVCPSCRYIVCLNCVPEGQLSCCRRCVVFETGVTPDSRPRSASSNQIQFPHHHQRSSVSVKQWINKTLNDNVIRPIATRLNTKQKNQLDD